LMCAIKYPYPLHLHPMVARFAYLSLLTFV
jgi:hypothetical protein